MAVFLWGNPFKLFEQPFETLFSPFLQTHRWSPSDDKDKFQVSVDVQQFAPDEITVKVSNDNTIVVEGKHEERKEGYGFASRHFVRKYVLPEEHDASTAVSSLSLDGILTITVLKKKTNEKSDERVIPIKHVGPSKL